MNTKRIIYWIGFIIVIALIIWGMIAAAQKSSRESAGLASPDQVTSSDWIRGNASSSVTFLEYGDFQCPACYAYFPYVERLYSESSSTVRFVYRHFPLPQHANAIPSALASEAAGKQGKFWEMYELIFTNHDVWENDPKGKEVFAGYAQQLGLDMAKYNADVASKEAANEVDMDLKGGQKAGINSTPTFYVNGKVIHPNSYEDFKKSINEALTATAQS